MRSLAREAVFKYIFSRLFNRNDEGLFNLLIKELSDENKQFATEILKSIDDNENYFIEKISSLSQNYKLERVVNADKCAILIGMAELTKFPKTPIAIVVDEAVKLSVKYSTESSAYFVNGILAEFIKEKK